MCDHFSDVMLNPCYLTSDLSQRSPVEHQEEHDLNSPSCEDRFEFPSNEFLNLSLGSLESDNCNEQTVIDNQGAEVRFDQKTGAVRWIEYCYPVVRCIMLFLVTNMTAELTRNIFKKIIGVL